MSSSTVVRQTELFDIEWTSVKMQTVVHAYWYRMYNEEHIAEGFYQKQYLRWDPGRRIKLCDVRVLIQHLSVRFHAYIKRCTKKDAYDKEILRSIANLEIESLPQITQGAAIVNGHDPVKWSDHEWPQATYKPPVETLYHLAKKSSLTVQ
ncbi:hypothetical protein MMC22_010133 [Lobaria immixta]|nr:hypothetical protein [Lobaria immixta]